MNKKKIPELLIYSRLLAGVILLLLAIFTPTGYRTAIVCLLVYGLVSDFFDGFIARRLNVSSEYLRKADSNVDQVYWLLVAIAAFILAPQFYIKYAWHIGLLIMLEASAYLISYLRFRNVVATHAIFSKLWVVTLLATFIQVVLTGMSGTIFLVCFWVGLLSRLEIIAIMLLLKQWVNDVPSVYHAVQLRNGKEIKRNKIFNG